MGLTVTFANFSHNFLNDPSLSKILWSTIINLNNVLIFLDSYVTCPSQSTIIDIGQILI